MAEQAKFIEPSGPNDWVQKFTIDQFGEGKLFDKFFDFMATKVGKEGDGKQFLDLVSKGVNLAELGLKGIFTLTAAGFLTLPLAKRGIESLVKQGKLRKEAAKRESERLEAELSRGEFLNQYLNTNYNVEILDSQQELISQAFEIEDIEDQKALSSSNIESFFFLNKRDLENSRNLERGIAAREELNKDIAALLAIDGLGENDLGKINNIYAYLTSKKELKKSSLPVESQAKIVELLNLNKDFNADRTERVLNELRRISIALRNGESLEGILGKTERLTTFFTRFAPSYEKENSDDATKEEKDEELLANIEKDLLLRQFLRRWGDSMRVGELMAVIKVTDDLALPDMMPTELRLRFNTAGIRGGVNPFLFLGFLGEPTAQQLEEKFNQYTLLDMELPDRDTFQQVLEEFYNRYPNRNIIRQNLGMLSQLSRKELEALDTLSTIFLQLRSPGTHIWFNYNGKSINIPKSHYIVDLLDKALTQTDGSNDFEYSSDGVNELILMLGNEEPSFNELKDLLTEANDISLILHDSIFGNQDIGYHNSVINFVKNLNPIFKYLFVSEDGDFPRLDRLTFRRAAREIHNQARTTINTKLRLAEQLQDIQTNDRERYQNLVSLNDEHINRIKNGEIVLHRNIADGRDHLNYINELRSISERLQSLNAEEHPELSELVRTNQFKVRDLIMSDDFDIDKDLPKLEKALTSLGRVLLVRYNQLVDEHGSSGEQNNNVVREVRFLTYYINLLKSIGYKFENAYDDNAFINGRVNQLKMYLNGYNLKLASADTNTVSETVSDSGDYTLRLGGNRIKINAIMPTAAPEADPEPVDTATTPVPDPVAPAP